MKQNRLVKLLIIFVIMLSIMLSGRTVSLAGTLTSDINGINDSRYPGVKNMIKNLQNKHRNYNFQVYYTGIDWTEAVTMEYQGHGRSPKNLFSVGQKYQGKWYCPICGSKTYDTGWYCASIDAIKYMMDPRNSLDETSVYQFKNLESADVSAGNIQAVINSKYSSYGYINNPTAINAIINASSRCNLNGYSILAKIVNEQGKGNSPLVTGAGYNGHYPGYYNFFNVGAYGNGKDTVILNGLNYAYKNGWNSVENSIIGGANYYKSSYIGKGQNTLYYQRFNVVYATSLFSHQYQQDIMGAQTSATLLKKYYETSGTLNSVNHTFIIPLYENMPATACARPSTTENSAIQYEGAVVKTNKAPVKASPNSSRIVSYLNANEKIKVLSRASKTSSDGKYWDTIVTETDGTYGYLARSVFSTTGEKGTIGKDGVKKVYQSTLPKYVFDSKYYADNNPELKNIYGYDEQKLETHYILCGKKEGRPSSATFNVKYYLEANPELGQVFGKNYEALYNHFMSYGCKEYRRSSPEYDGTFYRYYYSDLTNYSSIDLMNHYISKGKNEGRLGGLDYGVEQIVYDYSTYTLFNEEVRRILGFNPALLRIHWIRYGIAEGRVASYMYDADMYRTLNDDLQSKFGNNNRKLFEYFVKNGIKEKRATSMTFDMNEYLAKNPGLDKVFGNNYKLIYLHFKNYGINEGRIASKVFDPKTYLNENPGVKAIYGNNYSMAYMHFHIYGRNEARKASSTFDVRFYMSQYPELRNYLGKAYKNYYIHYLKYGSKEGRRGI